jgi:hypothetical protein
MIDDYEELKNNYDDNGLIIIRNHFSSAEVDLFRSMFQSASFLESGKKYIGFDELTISDEVMKRIISPRLKDVLNAIFLDAYILPDFILQHKNTPVDLLTPHYDLQSYLRQGMSGALLDGGHQYAKVGMYFQNSSASEPGSIWYVPGSHKYKIFRSIWKIKSVWLKVRLDRIAKRLFREKQAPLIANAGDLVIFDGRLLHSSAPVSNLAEVKAVEKFAVYFSAAGNLTDAKYYMRNEALKFADELTSTQEDDCQRIGYFFGDISSKLVPHCADLGVNFFALTGDFIVSKKSSV